MNQIHVAAVLVSKFNFSFDVNSRRLWIVEYKLCDIRLFKMFLSFYKEIIDARCFLFYINLLNYART